MQTVSETSFDKLDLLSERTLFVFALPSEAAEEFEHVNKVIVGIGKINAVFFYIINLKNNIPTD